MSSERSEIYLGGECESTDFVYLDVFIRSPPPILRTTPLILIVTLAVMSAAIMSNYYFPPPAGQRFVADTRYSLQNWMFAQMAQYPPPPPPDQQHYTALYPTAAGAQQLIDPQSQMQFTAMNQDLYSKVETTPGGQPSSNDQMHSLVHELHQHAALNSQTGHNIHQSSQQPQQQPMQGQDLSQPSSHQGTPDQNQKANRLRKACDSCSIRKVKVCPRNELRRRELRLIIYKV